MGLMSRKWTHFRGGFYKFRLFSNWIGDKKLRAEWDLLVL